MGAPHDPVLTTPRLALRPFTAADGPAFAALNASPVVMRFVGAPLEASQTAELLRRILAEDATGASGWLVVEQQADRAFVGCAMLKRLSELNRTTLGPAAGARLEEQFEVGWRFRPEFWRRGYATETGRALVRRGFEVLNLPRLVAVALVENVGSCRAIAKIGLQPACDYVVLEQAARMFVMSRAAYAAQYGVKTAESAG